MVESRRTPSASVPVNVDRSGGLTFPVRSFFTSYLAFRERNMSDNLFALEVSLKVKNDKPLIISEGSFISSKNFIPDIGKGKSVLFESTFKVPKVLGFTQKFCEVSWNADAASSSSLILKDCDKGDYVSLARRSFVINDNAIIMDVNDYGIEDVVSKVAMYKVEVSPSTKIDSRVLENDMDKV